MTKREILAAGEKEVERVFGLASKAYREATGAAGALSAGDRDLAASTMASGMAKLSESYWSWRGPDGMWGTFTCPFSSLGELELRLAAGMWSCRRPR